ncbi:MAG: hypothetical protein EBY07_10235 [Actinobacteria bacterium]|nr:hypothetical protein [Actinomycetota bacterium]
MANENQNTGPNLGGKGTPDPQALRQSLKQLLDDQGDFNNLLKNAISDLKRMDTSYAKIEARLSSLNKDSINVKQVNQELLRLRQKEFLESKKLRDLESEASQSAKDALSLAKERTGALMKDAAILGEQLDYEQTMLQYLQDAGDIEAIALYTAEKQLEIAKQQTIEGQKELELEKQLNKQIGITGGALKLLSDKLGIGNDYYAQMVAKARQLQAEGKKMTFFDKLGILGKSAAGGLKEAFSDPLTALPIIGTALGGIVKGFMSLVELGLQAQDRTVKFGRAVGLSKQEAQEVVNRFQQISLNSNSALVTIERLVESQKELSDELGVNNMLSDQILETNVKLKELAGLDAQTRAEIAKSSVITGQSSESISKSVLAQVVGLKQATGISFNYQKVLKEASNLGGYLGLSFAKYPAQLTKSLVTVKAMGMELKQLDSLADSFLDFESSISKEFEAQLLTGKDINLTKAREAFLNNDLATAASEITNQVGSANDFLKLNRIQAESLASAFGMSRDQMGEMLKQQEMLAKLGAKQGDSAREQLRLGLERYKTQKELSKAIGEEAYQSLVNASAQEKIAGFMDKIKEAIANFVANSPLIPLVERAIDWLSSPSNIKSIVSYVQGAFATIFDIFGSIASGVMKVLDFLPGIDIDDSLIEMVGRGGDTIRAMNLAGSIPDTISGASAKKEIGGGVNSQADNMSMARSTGNQNINLSVTTTVSDHKKDAEVRYSSAPDYDFRTGVNQ